MDRSACKPRASGSTSRGRALAPLLALVALTACAHAADRQPPDEPAATTQAAVAVSPAAAQATIATHHRVPAHPATRLDAASTPAAGRASSEPVATATQVAASRETAPAGPQIFAASIAPETVHAGDTVTFAVTTTADVSSVTARVTGYGIPLTRQGPGRFSLAFGIPSAAPFFMHGDYAVDMQAKTDDGRTADRTVSVHFR